MQKSWIPFLKLIVLHYWVGAQDVEIGAAFGITGYKGELSPAEFVFRGANIRPGGGVFARFLYSPSVGARLGLTSGMLAGDEHLGGGGQPDRGLAFRSHFVEFSGLGEFYLLNQRYFRSKMIFSIYLTAGVAVFHFDPKAPTTSVPVRLKPLRTEGQGLPGYGRPYGAVNMSIPYGFGLRFTRKSRWGIGVEHIFRRSFTDYLDDISAQEVRYGDILENFGAEAARRSNPLLDPVPANADVRYVRGDTKKDFYFTLGISISYRLVNRQAFKGHGIGIGECPRF